MATFSKTQGTSLLALQNIALSTVALGTPLDVSAKIAGTVFIHLGRTSSTAFTTAPIIRVEASAKGSTDGFWFPLTQFSPALGASLTAQAVSGTVNSGTNVITVAATTNFAVQDIIYVKNTTIANGEFLRVKSLVASTSLTTEDNLNNAQTGSTIYRAAEMYSAYMDLSAIGRVRIVVDNSANSVSGIDVEAFFVSADGFA